MDKLIDPLYDKAAEEADNKIIGTRILLTRQYAPGSMDESVAVILDDLFQYGQDLDASGHGENEHDALRVDGSSMEGMEVWKMDFSKADEIHLDEMTLLICNEDHSPFEDYESLVLLWAALAEAFELYRPIVTPITARDWNSVKFNELHKIMPHPDGGDRSPKDEDEVVEVTGDDEPDATGAES